MKIILLALTMMFFCSCSKQCVCTKWVGGVSLETFNVDLEVDGSLCEDYDAITMEETEVDGTLIELKNGISCVEYN